MKIDYNKFLGSKKLLYSGSGFKVELSELNSKLFDWQKILVRWALKRGCAALFEDCGLGKTIQQLEWAVHVVKKTGKPVIILAPLAVAEQTKAEGEKFGIQSRIVRDKNDVKKGINITNYEKLHKFDSSVFGGVVLDESSIIKSFSGYYRNEIILSFKNCPYRLACTATPSPNDYMELGNHSEFLGIMSRTEMLSMFFINDSGKSGKWRLKGHVKENVFWEWLSSWAVMLSKPSDLEFDDNGFVLPEITYHEHFVSSVDKRKGFGLIVEYAKDLNERRNVRKETITSRVKMAADFINSTSDRWVVWCNLNEEGNLLEKTIDDSVQVAGRHEEEKKLRRMFDFAQGKISRIVTKPKIAGHGMNWQICSRVAFVGLSDSWEDFYQAVRRVWRFGQNTSVEVHIFLEEREGSVLNNIKRKNDNAKLMMENMIRHTQELTKINIKGEMKGGSDYFAFTNMRLPKWL